jgi:putative ABC transport system permease protein
LLIGTFAVTALVLMCVGVYGVSSYLISRRFKELGIRVALGASPGGVVRLLVGEGAAVVAMGILLGLTATVVLTRAMSSILFGVTYFDLDVYLSVTAIVATTVLAAMYLPASRATKVDPVKVLRDE